MTGGPVVPSADEMKDRLRACTSIEAVNATVREIAPFVAELEMSDEVSDRIAAHHIRNLAAFRRSSIRYGF